ncbi:DNA-directed RNA polymerase III subunit RPC6 [Nephila pilipes]|uniref:DNA-directed RNA polymerase III subunit RPC6 n=1 Tax=Nephila pilipes TaxID=299642 RepID=A0A8X6N4V7_NEPPI|nr:DNA-directed RNA polymerase III subunit RPC6 [Nephila pilipes]
MTEQKGTFNSESESTVIATLKNHPSGVTQKILMDSIPSLAVLDLAQILNKLISQGKIDLLKKGKQLVYALKDDSSKKSQGADVEENLILDAVKKAGDNGITAKDLKFATNLPQPQITKMLKNMESRRIVKSVVACNKKKLFMLFELQPSHTVTGGTFFTGQEFETEFVDVLGDQCYRYLLQAKGLADKLTDPVSQRLASFKSSRDICDYINSLKISKIELKLPDIEKILEALVYDNKVEKSISLTNSSTKESGSENFYKVTKSLISSAGLMRMPCGVCPVYYECGKGKTVSPSTCVYMKEWLDL